MAMAETLQLGLFGGGDVDVPAPAADHGVRRAPLSDRSWLEHAPAWLPGSDHLLEALVVGAAWTQGRRVMFDRLVDEPRLTAWYSRDGPLPHPLLGGLFERFDRRYGQCFDTVGLNWYRDGQDSVAWHSDRVGRSGRTAIVVIVSLGEPRPFLLRPRGGGRSRSFLLGGGDLLVMGGDCQHEFQHTVPKVAYAGPRVSVTFRHGARRATYERTPVRPPTS
jgi:alkylated DNA repair dioxygenase AlkB